MKNMQKNKRLEQPQSKKALSLMIILVGILTLFAIGLTLAAIVVDYHSSTLNNIDGADGTGGGFRIVTNYNITLRNVTRDSGVTCTTAGLYSSTLVSLANATFVGDNAPFNYNLTGSTTYYVVCGIGTVYNRHSTTVDPSYPVADTNINWTGGWHGTDNTAGWNIVSISSEKYEGSGAPTPPLSVTLLSPVNDTQTNNDSISFTATLTPSSYNLTNATFYIWRDNGTLFNYTTNATPSSLSAENVTFTIEGFTIDNYIWNVIGVQGNSNGTNSSFATDNFTLEWVPFENSGESYEGFTYETKNETFYVNITTDSDVTNIGAFLVYNNSRYAATHSCSSGLCQIRRMIDIPLLDTQALNTENNTFYWQVTLFGTFGTFTTNTTSHQQNATNINFGNAASGARAVNYSIFNETSLSLINSQFNATFKYYLGTGSVSESKNFSLSGSSSYNFYINHNQTFIVNSTIDISAAESKQRNYFFLKEVYTNVPTEQKLFIPSNSASNIIIEVKNQGLTAISGYWVKVYRYYSELNTYNLVASQMTDEFGQFIAKLVESDVKYKFEFYDGDKILKKTSLDLAIACRSSICIVPFIIETEDGVFDRFENIPFFDYDFTFDNSTNIFTFSWDDQTEERSTMRLEVIRTTLNSTTTACNSTSTATVSSITCSVGSSKASYKAQIFRSVDGEELRIDIITVNVGDIFSTFGVEGLLWAFILLFTCVGIGAFNPSVGALLYGAGFIVLGIIGIISMPLPVFFANTLLVAIFIWAIRT